VEIVADLDAKISEAAFKIETL